MVDPTNIPLYMTRQEREYWVLFSIAVANKSAKQTERKMAVFLDNDTEPFQHVRKLIKLDALGGVLKNVRMGQYRRIERAFRESVSLDVMNLTVEKLQGVHGIGPKTARLILLYSQPDYSGVPLDTHVLKFLRAKGYKAPKHTPQSAKRYSELEKAFQNEAAKDGKTVKELDTEVWQRYAKI